MSYLPIGKDTGNHNVQGNPDLELREQDRWLPIANVARLMKNTLPTTAKVSKDAKECMQECVSEFISFITSEASDKCLREKRKTINGEDILYLMHDLGFENYAEVLKIYLAKYREQQALKQERGETRTAKKIAKKLRAEDPELQDQNADVDHEYIKNETMPDVQLDGSQRLEQLSYSDSPQNKDIPSPDYFHPYESNENGENAALAGDVSEDHMKHDLQVRVDGLDGGIDKEGYRYGDFLHEENEEPKDNGKNGHNLNDLTKLAGEDADIDNLATGITSRNYY